MKRWAAVLVLLGTMLLLSGCRRELIRMVNLQDRAIVQGVGIDWDGDNFLVTMQVFSPEGSGGQTMVDASKENARIISCQGKTVAEAVEKTALNQGKEFYLGHNRIVILGYQAAQLPLEGILSYFVSSLDSRPDVSLLVTSGKAEEIISAKITQSILPAMSIENTVSNAERNGLTEEVFLIDVLEALAQPYRSTLIPFIELDSYEDSESDQSGEKDLRSVRIGGIGLFSDEEYLGMVEGEGITGLLFLRNKMKGAVFSLESDDFKRAAVQLYFSDTVLKQDEHSLLATITCDATLLELELQQDAVFDNESVTALEKELESQIEKVCRQAFRQTVSAGADIYYIGDRLWNQNPSYWKQIRDSWPDHMSEMELKCSVSANILRTGLRGTE